jgi:hypothetical protein
VLQLSTLLGHPQATHLLEGTSIALLRLFPMDCYQHVIFRSVFAASLCFWGWTSPSTVCVLCWFAQLHYERQKTNMSGFECNRMLKYNIHSQVFTHEKQAGKRYATDGTVHLQYFLWMWQKLHWRNRQTSSRAVPWTQAHSPTGSPRNIKISRHAYQEGHSIGWDEVRVLEIESNSKKRKYMVSAPLANLANPIS